MTSKADIVEYYKDTYGQKWTRAIAESLHGSVKNRNGEDVSIKNIQRRFQGDRLEKEMSKRDKGLYEQVGKELPPVGKKLENNTITVTVVGTQGGRTRSWTATFTGADAYDFADNPDYRTIFNRLGYPPHVIDMFEGDDEYGIEVVSVS